MKKLIILFLFIASGLFAQEQSYSGGYFQKSHWTLISATTLSTVYDIGIKATGKFYFDVDGDLDNYLYESSEDIVRWFIGGANSWEFDGSAMGSRTLTQSALMHEDATPTNPNVVPNQNDPDTAPSGWANADQGSVVAGAVEVIRYSEGDGEVSAIIGGTVVETITDATSAGDATLTKAGENFDVTCSVGDAVLVYGGTTAGDYGTYIITVVTSATVLTLDRALAGSDSDVDFDVVADGVIIENSTTTGVATLRVPTFTQHVSINAGAASLGPNAPTATTLGTWRTLQFDNDNEEVFAEFEIGEDWDGVSDMTLKLYLFPHATDQIQVGEIVEFDATYRSIEEGEAYDNGTAVVINPTYTQAGSELGDKLMFET